MNRKASGIIIPADVSQAPRPVIPFFPFKTNNPVNARIINDAAKRSENHVHNFLGVL